MHDGKRISNSYGKRISNGYLRTGISNGYLRTALKTQRREKLVIVINVDRSMLTVPRFEKIVQNR